MASGRLGSHTVVQLEESQLAVTSDASVVSSDAAAPMGPVKIDGFNMAHCILILDTFVDSASTVTPTFQKNTSVNTRNVWDASDFSTLKAQSAVAVTGEDSDSVEIRMYEIDLVKHGLSSGLLRTSMVASESDSANAKIVWILTRASQKLPDTDQVSVTDVSP